MKSELDIMELKLKVLDKIREGLKREWKEEDELDSVGYMNFYMGMKKDMIQRKKRLKDTRNIAI